MQLPLVVSVSWLRKKKLLSISLSHEMLIVFERATKCCLMTQLFFFLEQRLRRIKGGNDRIGGKVKVQELRPESKYCLEFIEY